MPSLHSATAATAARTCLNRRLLTVPNLESHLPPAAIDEIITRR